MATGQNFPTRIEISGRLYDYPTIAQFAEKRANGANIHRIKVELATIRELIIDIAEYGVSEGDEVLLLAALKDIGYVGGGK